MTSIDESPEPGWRVVDAEWRLIGTVDAVFADYLLVRTRGLLPVDLYVPRTELVASEEPGTAKVTATDAEAAYQTWHRPLKKAPHD
jgi:hypothetical protein